MDSLEEVASPAQTRRTDTSDIDYSGDYISYFLHISANHSRTSPEPGLKPFVERSDILRAIKASGFDDEDMAIKTSVCPTSLVLSRKLKIMGLNQRPHVAKISKIDGDEQYYAKYLTPYQFSEINILKYLSKFNAPHIPTNMTYRKLEEGALLFIPYLGEPVERYEHLNRDLLSIIHQFLEGVAFLHSKYVAHLDLKPSHVLVNKDGSVYIIDYDLSMRFKDAMDVTSGYLGTEGYTAPEVGEEEAYNPFLADVFSAGRVIYDLILFRYEHEAGEFLTNLSKKMMEEDPMKRPSAQDAFREVAEFMIDSGST